MWWLVPDFSQPPPYQVDVRRRGDTIVMAVSGEIDLTTGAAFEAALREQLGQGPVLLDLSRLSFMDSSGIRALNAVLGDVEREGWRLRVRRELPDNVRQILRITAMHDALPFEDDGQRP